MMNDPIVEEIHQLRRKLMAECAGDLDRLLARLREREEEDASRVVSSVEEGQRLLLFSSKARITV
jgi:hypothetical protein